MEKKCIQLLGLFLTCLLVSCSSAKKENTSYEDIQEITHVEKAKDLIVEEDSHSEKLEKPALEFNPPIIVEDRKEMLTQEELNSASDAIMSADKSIEEVEVLYCSKEETKRGSKRSVSQEQIPARLLTATEINDFDKWNEWGELLEDDFSSYLNIWGIVPRTKYTIRVADKQNNPIVDAEVWLSNPLGGIEWSACTDNRGVAHLWADAIPQVSQSQGNIQRGQKKTVSYNVGVRYLYEERTLSKLQSNGVNEVRMETTSRPSKNVDLFFMVDATGSMEDELHYLQAELTDIIKRVDSNQSGLNIRMGSLVYRDRGDDYVVRKSSFDRDISKTISFLKKQRADGGGDTPEAVDEALFQCVENETWSRDALARIAFLVLDAPPHEDKQSIQRVQKQVRLAAKKGIRLIPLVASGMDQSGEFLMRSMALSTNGTYVALTDDSGIGNSHAKPTTSFYKVEKLNDLLVRLINEYTRRPSIVKQ